MPCFSSLGRSICGGVLVVGLLMANAAQAIDSLKTKADGPPPGIRTFSSMPRSASDIASAYLRAANQSVEFLQKGEPLELSSYTPYLTRRDRIEKHAKLPNPSTRRSMFSIGVQVSKEDQVRLPKLSAALILDYLSDHYVSVQARIQKDAGTGTLYLHQRPIVVTSKYGTIKLTEDFAPAVANSVRDIHSLGLYVPVKTPPTPENLRTLVLIHKHDALDAKSNRIEPRYELVIVRGRANFGGSKLELHCFATSDERTQLHYLKSGRAPTRFNDCTLRANVYFSRYTGGDLVPADSVLRSQTINSQATFDMKDLNSYTRNSLKLSGDALTNINEVLDAIIDGKLRPGAEAAARPGAARPSGNVRATSSAGVGR
jgi:hypothetical protein